MKLPAALSRFQRSLSVVACGLLVTTAQAWGFEERQHKMDWESSLNLSEEQQEKIDAIEDKYRSQFRELKPSEAAEKGRSDKRQDLYLQMREEIHAVLTTEQQAVAEEQVRRREKAGREEHLDRLARDLDLSAEQREQLEEKLSTCKKEAWPVSVEERDSDRKEFNEALVSVLTDEQKEKWQALRERHRAKWSNHDMKRLPHDGEKPGRKGPPKEED